MLKSLNMAIRMVRSIGWCCHNRQCITFLFTPTMYARHSSDVAQRASTKFDIETTLPGKVIVKSCGDVEIKPAKYSEIGNTYCKVSGESGYFSNLVDIEGRKSFSVDSKSRQAIVIEVPHHYDVSVENTGEEVSIILRRLESNSVFVYGKTANCILDNIKGMKTEVFLECGSADFRNGFIGNVTTSIREGKIKATKIQGSDISLHVAEGSIDIASLYSSNQTNISMGNGDVKIGSCHGNTRTFISQGNFSAGSVDGQLVASLLEEGNLTVHLGHHTTVQLLASKGCVNVSMSETSHAKLDAECEELVTDDKVLFHITDRDEQSTRVEGVVMGSTDSSNERTSPNNLPLIKVKTKTLSLKVKEWISSFNFSEQS